MVSAFERPRFMEVVAVPLKEEERSAKNESKYAETETEDEEVKMNCIGGFAGIEDSDISSDEDDSSTSSSDDSGDDSSSQEERDEILDMPVLNFSTIQVRQSYAIQRPRPTRASPNDSMIPNPAASDDDDSDMERHESDDESGTESDDEASDSEDDDSDDEDDEEIPVATPTRPVVRIVESIEKLQDYEQQQRKSMIDVEKELQTRHTDLESLIGEDEVEERDDLNDDDIMGSAVLDRSISRNMPLVGEADQEPSRQQAFKRCLSPESVDSSGDDYSSASSSKRMRCEDTSTPTLVLPELTLGPSAFLSAPAPSVSPSCCSETDDQRLSEELLEAVTIDWESEERDETDPVPLLTPPGSPLPTSSTAVCEWPSNLTIDNAIHLMPPITNCCSIAESENELEFGDRNETPPVMETRPPSSHLTPLIRGLAV